MKQQCYLISIYLSWAIVAVITAYFLWKKDSALALLLLTVTLLFQWVYIRFFPAISRYVGYGSVADRPAKNIQPASVKVTLYTALGCPFCPIVKHRLLTLKEKMGFELKQMNVTHKPHLLMAKGIHAVPVVEVGEKRIVGNATTEQLVDLIAGSQQG